MDRRREVEHVLRDRVREQCRLPLDDAGAALGGGRRARLAGGPYACHRTRGRGRATRRRRSGALRTASAGMTGLPGSKGDVNVVAGGAMGSGLARFGRVLESGARARRGEQLDDVEHELVQVARDELVDLVEHEEAHLTAREAARRGKESMQLLWRAAEDVRHVLLKEAELLGEVGPARGGTSAQRGAHTDGATQVADHAGVPGSPGQLWLRA